MNCYCCIKNIKVLPVKHNIISHFSIISHVFIIFVSLLIMEITYVWIKHRVISISSP